MSRLKKPCRFCKGESKSKCMFCGHKKKKVTAFRDLSPEEQLRIIGKRNLVQFLHGMDRSSSRANNASTHCLHADEQLRKHREWAFAIYRRVFVIGRAAKDIAKEEELTESMILKIANLMRDKLGRGQTEFLPNQDEWLVTIHHRWKSGETADQIAESSGWNRFEVACILDLVEQRKANGELQNVKPVIKPVPPKKPEPYKFKMVIEDEDSPDAD